MLAPGDGVVEPDIDHPDPGGPSSPPDDPGHGGGGGGGGGSFPEITLIVALALASTLTVLSWWVLRSGTLVTIGSVPTEPPP